MPFATQNIHFLTLNIKIFNTMSQQENYSIVNGTAYHITTSKTVIEILEESRRNKTRLLLDYGDTETGQSWGERYDIQGHIGRSAGTTKVPLLIHNSRSMGGGHILDHCIVKISLSKGKQVLYQHPTYKPSNN